MRQTPASKWKSMIITTRKTCQAILEISDDIRYAGAINEYGRTMAGILRPGLVPLLKPKQARDEFFIVASILRMRKDLVKALGNLDHITMQYDQAYIVTLQHNGLIYYISINTDVKNISRLIVRIKKAIHAGVKP